MQRNRQLTIGLLLGALVVLAGCAQIGVRSTVTADGAIEEYEMNITTSRTTYGYIEQSAEEDGYENVREYMLSDVNRSAAENVSFSQAFEDDEVTMSISMSEVDPSKSENLSVTKENGNITYVDVTFYNESDDENSTEAQSAAAFMQSFSVDYYLTMPGNITESNADKVTGQTAEWHENGADAFTDNRIYAKSTLPSSSGSGPGFGPLVAVLAVLGLAAFLLRH
jgi:PGF-CTERM protein